MPARKSLHTILCLFCLLIILGTSSATFAQPELAPRLEDGVEQIEPTTEQIEPTTEQPEPSTTAAADLVALPTASATPSSLPSAPPAANLDGELAEADAPEELLDEQGLLQIGESAAPAETSLGQACSAAAPRLNSPANGLALSNLIPEYHWNAVSGVKQFRFQLSRSPTFQYLSRLARVSDNVDDGKVAIHSFDNLFSNTTYYWRVASICQNGVLGPYSDVFTFRTPAANSPYLDAPAIISPPNGALIGSTRATFLMNLPAGATNSQLRFYDSYNEAILNDWYLVWNNPGSAYESFPENTTVYWRARSSNAYGFAPLGNVYSFKTPNQKSTGSVSPTTGGSLSTSGGVVKATFPAGAVSSPITLNYQMREEPLQSVGLSFAGRAFSLTATNASGQRVTKFAKPFTLSVSYSKFDLAALGITDPKKLNIHFWNGKAWQPIMPCSGCSIDIVNQRITVKLDHLTEFAIGLQLNQRIYIPMIQR